MKINIHQKSGFSSIGGGQRTGGIRPTLARALERRYVRRKIREQLRRLDSVLNGKNEIFA